MAGAAVSCNLCDCCALDYFSVIAKFHGEYYGRGSQEAIDFLRQHKVLPNSIKCPNCETELKFRSDKHLWYCNL